MKIFTVSGMIYPALLLAASVFLVSGCSSGWLFSNRGYKKSIVTEAYLLNKEQVIALFSGQKVVQLPYGGLSDPVVYFVVRLRNTEHYRAWGELKCRADNGLGKTVGFSLPPYQDFVDDVSPICKMTVFDKEKMKIPTFTYEWIELHTK